MLLWIARGKSNRDIAEILSLCPRTVNKHLEQIYAKLGVENRTSAAALAMRTLGHQRRKDYASPKARTIKLNARSSRACSLGKLFAPFLPRAVKRVTARRNTNSQRRAPPVCDSVVGALALRSLVACARRRSAGIAEK